MLITRDYVQIQNIKVKYIYINAFWAPCSCPHSLTGLDGAHGMHFILRSLLRVLTKDLTGNIRCIFLGLNR